jgi:hypothetical protein
MSQPRPDERQHPLSTPYLDRAYVADVVAIEDPMVRNAAITRGYHELSNAVASVLGRDHANWLTFGQWASAEARQSIDGELVPAVLRPAFANEVEQAVAQGNAAIFGDIAPSFIRFVELYRGADALLAGGRDRLELRAALLGDPVINRTDDLRLAFRGYADAADLAAAGSADSKLFAGRMLVGNVGVAAHEQAMADPFIRAAIPGRWLLAVAATTQMHLDMPDGALPLAKDVPPPSYLDGEMFPEPLRELDDPDAVAYAQRFNQRLDSAAHSRAADWEEFRERMGYIFTLFRAHQCNPGLFALPPGAFDPSPLGR